LAIILVDIDNFKQFNDLHGHDCGDYILVEIAKVMKQQLGSKDRIARWGGEEFLIFLPTVDETGLWRAAEKIRTAIYETNFVYKGLRLQATVTCGASMFSSAEKVDAAIKNADNGLYAGKQKGKNCVIVQASAF
jgi:diguanylate cyclase (GGDEF)-like protein